MRQWRKKRLALMTAAVMLFCTAVPAAANDGGAEYAEALKNDNGSTVLTVYDQNGVDGQPVKTKEYSLSALDQIAEHEASYAYEYMKSSEWSVWATSVCSPLETILSDCGISFNEGDQIIVSAGTDGFSYTLTYEVYQNAINFYPSVTKDDLTNMENGITVPCVIGICWDGARPPEGSESAADVRDELLESSFYSGSLRLFLGSKADDFYNAGSSGGREASSTVAGNRSVNGVDSLTVMHDVSYDYLIEYMSREEKPYQKFYLKKGAVIPVPDTHPNVPENVGTEEEYEFDYWYRIGPDGKEIRYEPDVVATEDVRYLPKWKKKGDEESGDSGESADPGDSDSPGENSGEPDSPGDSGTADTYGITISETEHGNVVSDRKKAEKGETVSITVTPEEGYKTDSLKVYQNKDGTEVSVTPAENGKYSFTMPAGEVKITAVFSKQDQGDNGNPPQENDPEEEQNCPSAAYIDLDRNLWYHAAVDFVLEHMYFNGTSDTTFEPDRTMTRAMFVTVLSRIEGINESQYSGSSFSDVPTGEWLSAAIQWASQNSVVTGIGDNLFDPNGDVTCEQMAAIMYRYANFKGINTSGVDTSKFDVFTDRGTVSDWAVEAMTWATAMGIINGMGDNTLAPQETATRAQVAQIINNIMNS